MKAAVLGLGSVLCAFGAVSTGHWVPFVAAVLLYAALVFVKRDH